MVATDVQQICVYVNVSSLAGSGHISTTLG